MAQRTCVACRQEAERGELVRLVVSPGGDLVLDLRGNLPGRGAWVHPQTACVGRGVRAASKRLRAPGDPERVLLDLRAATWRAVRDGLSQAAAAGALVGGRDVLERALLAGEVDLLVFATDASERTRRGLSRAAEAVPEHEVPFDREALGQLVGRGSRAALGVKPSRATTHLRRQLRRAADLG